MSVPQGERKESKLEVIVRARNLAKYVLVITKNPNVFSPEYNNGINNLIISTAIHIYLDCWKANNIFVRDNPALAGQRDALQQQAIDGCNSLLALIALAQELYHLKAKRVSYWGKLTLDCRSFISAWRNSDRKRYAALLERAESGRVQ